MDMVPRVTIKGGSLAKPASAPLRAPPAAPAASAMAIKLNLSESAIGKDYELTGMGKELEMYLDADQLKAVLGIDIDNLSAKDEYVTVKVVTDGTNLRSVSISYSTENGDVTIETSYTYNSVVSPFEEIPAKTEE